MQYFGNLRMIHFVYSLHLLGFTNFQKSQNKFGILFFFFSIVASEATLNSLFKWHSISALALATLIKCDLLMKKIMLRVSAILLMAFMVFANITINVENSSFDLGIAIAAYAFGDDIPGGSGTECQTMYGDCNFPYLGCANFKYCEPVGTPCSQLTNKMPLGNVLPC